MCLSLVQTVSGAPSTAFWASAYLWDLCNYAISAAGLMLTLLTIDCSAAAAASAVAAAADNMLLPKCLACAVLVAQPVRS